MRTLICVFMLAMGEYLHAQSVADNPQARPPVTKTGLEIVKRAKAILNSPSKWNRADNRICPVKAKTFSLYCALEKATREKSGNFEHRGAAMQEARFVIEQVAPNVNRYQHRLMDYNNDPTTMFADVQKVFGFWRIVLAKRLAGGPLTPPARVAPPTGTGNVTPAAVQVVAPATQTDLKVLQSARAILNSPAKWNRADKQVCEAEPQTVSLFCAFQIASKEVNGIFDNSGAVIQEARAIISELDPQRLKYRARLTDYNNDPAITFAEVGQVTETVDVVAGTPLLDPNTSTLGAVVDLKKVEDLPLNGRNPMGLANLIPTVRSIGWFGGQVVSTWRMAAISIGGGAPTTNDFMIDGMANTKMGDAGGPMNFLAADNTQEFRVETNAMSAEFGRTGGGAMSIVSKGGTNRFHGSLFEYLRRTRSSASSRKGRSARLPRLCSSFCGRIRISPA